MHAYRLVQGKKKRPLCMYSKMRSGDDYQFNDFVKLKLRERVPQRVLGTLPAA